MTNLTEDQIRRATAAGINDSVNAFLKGLCFAVAFAMFCIHPLLGCALLFGALGVWLAWRLALRWLLPSTWRAWAANRRYQADVRAFVAEYPHHNCQQVISGRTPQDYERIKARMQLELAHPSNWKPFEDWRAARRDAADKRAAARLTNFPDM
jgi:hypothetical protein